MEQSGNDGGAPQKKEVTVMVDVVGGSSNYTTYMATHKGNMTISQLKREVAEYYGKNPKDIQLISGGFSSGVELQGDKSLGEMGGGGTMAFFKVDLNPSNSSATTQRLEESSRAGVSTETKSQPAEQKQIKEQQADPKQKEIVIARQGSEDLPLPCIVDDTIDDIIARLYTLEYISEDGGQAQLMSGDMVLSGRLGDFFVDWETPPTVTLSLIPASKARAEAPPLQNEHFEQPSPAHLPAGEQTPELKLSETSDRVTLEVIRVATGTIAHVECRWNEPVSVIKERISAAIAESAEPFVAGEFWLASRGETGGGYGKKGGKLIGGIGTMDHQTLASFFPDMQGARPVSIAVTLVPKPKEQKQVVKSEGKALPTQQASGVSDPIPADLQAGEQDSDVTLLVMVQRYKSTGLSSDDVYVKCGRNDTLQKITETICRKAGLSVEEYALTELGGLFIDGLGGKHNSRTLASFLSEADARGRNGPLTFSAVVTPKSDITPIRVITLKVLRKKGPPLSIVCEEGETLKDVKEKIQKEAKLDVGLTRQRLYLRLSDGPMRPEAFSWARNGEHELWTKQPIGSWFPKGDNGTLTLSLEKDYARPATVTILTSGGDSLSYNSSFTWGTTIDEFNENLSRGYSKSHVPPDQQPQLMLNGQVLEGSKRLGDCFENWDDPIVNLQLVPKPMPKQEKKKASSVPPRVAVKSAPPQDTPAHSPASHHRDSSQTDGSEGTNLTTSSNGRPSESKSPEASDTVTLPQQRSSTIQLIITPIHAGMKGRNAVVECEKTSTIGSLKEHIFTKYKIPIGNQMFWKNRREIKDGEITIGSCFNEGEVTQIDLVVLPKTDTTATPIPTGTQPDSGTTTQAPPRPRAMPPAQGDNRDKGVQEQSPSSASAKPGFFTLPTKIALVSEGIYGVAVAVYTLVRVGMHRKPAGKLLSASTGGTPISLIVGLALLGVVAGLAIKDAVTDTCRNTNSRSAT